MHYLSKKLSIFKCEKEKISSKPIEILEFYWIFPQYSEDKKNNIKDLKQKPSCYGSG